MKKNGSFYKKIVTIQVLIAIVAILTTSLFLGYYLQYNYKINIQKERRTIASHVVATISEQAKQTTYTISQIQTEFASNDFSQEQITNYLLERNRVSQNYINNIFVWDPTLKYLSDPFYQDICEQLVDLPEELKGCYIPKLSYEHANSAILFLPSKIQSMPNSVLCVDISLVDFNQLMSNVNFDSKLSFIGVNSNSELVLTDVKMKHEEYTSLYDSYFEMIDNSTTYKLEKSISGQEYSLYLYEMYLCSDKWTLVALIDQSVDSSIVWWEIFPYLLGFILFFSILTAGGTTLALKSITQAIHKLQNHIVAIRDKNFTVQLDGTPPKEFKKLFHMFNDMSIELDKTIEEKVEIERTKQQYEYQVLLAQVSPHFLYNSLYSIDALLDLKRYSDIKIVTSALISLLSYSIGKQGTEVTLRAELYNVEQYVAMQQIRHSSKFNLEINVSEKLQNQKTMRMILIPLVENSVFHGFAKGTREEDNISISAEEEVGGIVIYVKDNGIGMDDNTVKYILDKQQKSTAMSPSKYVSIGVLNIHERIRMKYGDSYGLTVYSSLGAGTLVEVHIPNEENNTWKQ